MSVATDHENGRRLALFHLLLAISFVARNEGAKEHFKTFILRGHFYVNWTVDKSIFHSNKTVTYSINFCPRRLNLGIDGCEVTKSVCSAIYNGKTYEGVIKEHPENITKFLTNMDYEEINNTIEAPGPIVEGDWDRETGVFSCRVFMHRCMDGQFRPKFVFLTTYDGTPIPENSGQIHLSDGPPVKAENVSIAMQTDGCCSYNVRVTWQIVHVCRVDVPDFKVWLTQNRTTVSEMRMTNEGRKVYSFEYTFKGLRPMKFYTVHIESFKNEDGNKTYVNKDFRTYDIKLNMKIPKATVGGYVFFSWPVDDYILRHRLHAVYNIKWCPPCFNQKLSNVSTCKYSMTICGATYNGSSSEGHIQLYEEKLTNNSDYIKIMNSSSTQLGKSWLTGSWNDKKKTFTCAVFLNPCVINPHAKVFMKYEININGSTFKTFRKIGTFENGFTNDPEITTNEVLKDGNNVHLNVTWRYRRVCGWEVSTSSNIWLTTTDNQQRIRQAKKVRSHAEKTAKNITEFRWAIMNLLPYTLYDIHIKGNRDAEVVRTVRTPEGVPSSSPVIEPVVDNEDSCIDGKRNVSVSWKLPRKEERNGIIRNTQLEYWKASHVDEKAKLNVGNATSRVLVGLNCDVDYKVQVRACIRQNKSCSGYSEIQDIKAKDKSQKKLRGKKLSSIFVWTSIVVVVVFVFMAFYICQYIYRRRRRTPLTTIGEDTLTNDYQRPREVELAAPGEYRILHESKDEFQ